METCKRKTMEKDFRKNIAYGGNRTTATQLNARALTDWANPDVPSPALKVYINGMLNARPEIECGIWQIAFYMGKLGKWLFETTSIGFLVKK